MRAPLELAVELAVLASLMCLSGCLAQSFQGQMVSERVLGVEVRRPRVTHGHACEIENHPSYCKKHEAATVIKHPP